LGGRYSRAGLPFSFFLWLFLWCRPIEMGDVKGASSGRQATRCQWMGAPPAFSSRRSRAAIGTDCRDV
jgi:hypothetical protein